MIYLKNLILPSESCEDNVLNLESRTCFSGFYPFRIFPQKKLRELELDHITMLYGGNGSGKSTLLNVIAEKIGADRFCDFNNSAFFDQYLELCNLTYRQRPKNAMILSSDDVFDYALSARAINGEINDRRAALIEQYCDIKEKAKKDPSIMWLRGLDDYERWRDTMDIVSPKKSQSKYVKNRVNKDIDLFSNGETAKRYFFEKIDKAGIYLLDEPENSLSVEFQMELAEYISLTARAESVQFVIATHSPIFLSLSGAKIYNLDAKPVRCCGWTDLPNVRKYFEFFQMHKDEFR